MWQSFLFFVIASLRSPERGEAGVAISLFEWFTARRSQRSEGLRWESRLVARLFRGVLKNLGRFATVDRQECLSHQILIGGQAFLPVTRPKGVSLFNRPLRVVESAGVYEMREEQCEPQS